MDTVFCTCARHAREHTGNLDMHCFQLTLALPFASANVFDCLRDLSCLVHWWPHAKSIQPLPPGLCNVGDMAIFSLTKSDALLRVLIFKPGKRMVLALGLEPGLVLLDLSVKGDGESCGGKAQESCELQFRLETPRSGQPIRELRQWLWLRTLGARAAAGMERHLRNSERVYAPLMPVIQPVQR